MNVNSGQVNVFGGRAGSGVNPNLLSNLIINMNQKFVSKQEAEEKYLDQTEGDKLYINEPITENIDMKDKKISSSAVPTDSHDLVNKYYVDESVRSLVADHSREEQDWIGQNYASKGEIDKLVNKNELKYATKTEIKKFTKKTDILKYPFKNTKFEKMAIYYNIAITYEPKVWISGMFPLGLFCSLDKIHKPTVLNDIMGNKVHDTPQPTPKDSIQNLVEGTTIFTSNVLYAAEKGFELNNVDGKISRIIINIDFKIDYSFIFVCRKVVAQDIGSIFTSATPNRTLGWDSDDKAFKVGSGEIRLYNNKDIDLHCYVVTCLMGECKFWDIDYKNSTTVTENYGKVVIGKAYESLETNDKGRGIFYELILFDKALSNEDVESIIKFLKSMYDFTSKTKAKPSSGKVIDDTVLQNLA